MTAIAHYPHVTVGDPWDQGFVSAYVTGSRVPVSRIFGWYRKGTSAEALIARYPLLGPAAVLSAIAFGFDNEEMMRADEEHRALWIEPGGATPTVPVKVSP